MAVKKAAKKIAKQKVIRRRNPPSRFLNPDELEDLSIEEFLRHLTEISNVYGRNFNCELLEEHLNYINNSTIIFTKIL